jgi:DNA-binding ferritin-like protein (Dps family)
MTAKELNEQTEREQARMIARYLTKDGMAGQAEIVARMASLKEEREATGKSVLEIVADRLAKDGKK